MRLLRTNSHSRPRGLALLAAGILAAAALGASCAREGEAAPRQETEWLRSYLQIDTTNPPGNEAEAAALLREILHREGVTTQLLVSPAGRTSLYARIDAPGSPASETLLLTHHIDVVAPGPGWEVDPFAATVRDGAIWGRGAVDVKSLGIAQLAALLAAKRASRLERNVAFLAVADEEAGGGEGTRWLLDRHPELFKDVTAVLGEGGANRAIEGRIFWWGIEVAQKRPLWLEATAYGRSGHGSMYYPGSAPHQLTLALARLLESTRPYRATSEARAYMEAVAPYQPVPFQAMVAELDTVVAADNAYQRMFPGTATYFADSLQVNVLSAGERINSVPGSASARIDIRLLPDTDSAEFLDFARTALGEQVQVEVLLDGPRVEASPTDNSVFRCLETSLGPRPVVPAFIPGITDSRFYRGQGIPAYGFSPFALDATETLGIHGKNERISIEAFLAGVDVYVRVVLGCAGASGS